jgi:hypothetical protein
MKELLLDQVDILPENYTSYSVRYLRRNCGLLTMKQDSILGGIDLQVLGIWRKRSRWLQ